MSTETNAVKQAVQDRIQAQIMTAQSKLEMLKVKAEAAKAIAEVKAISDLLSKKRALDEKLSALKATSGDSRWEQAKADVESRVADLEKSVQAIESKFKAA